MTPEQMAERIAVLEAALLEACEWIVSCDCEYEAHGNSGLQWKRRVADGVARLRSIAGGESLRCVDCKVSELWIPTVCERCAEKRVDDAIALQRKVDLEKAIAVAARLGRATQRPAITAEEEISE